MSIDDVESHRRATKASQPRTGDCPATVWWASHPVPLGELVSPVGRALDRGSERWHGTAQGSGRIWPVVFASTTRRPRRVIEVLLTCGPCACDCIPEHTPSQAEQLDDQVVDLHVQVGPGEVAPD